MKKNIAIIELLHHQECLMNLVNKYSNSHTITLILGSYVNDFLNVQDYQSKTQNIHILQQKQRTGIENIPISKKIFYKISQFFEIYKNIQNLKKLIKKESIQEIHLATGENIYMLPFLIYLLVNRSLKINITIHNLQIINKNCLQFYLYGWLIRKITIKTQRIILLGNYLKFTEPVFQNKVYYLNNRITYPFKNKKFEKVTFLLIGRLKFKDKNKDNYLVLKTFKKLKENYPFLEQSVSLLLWSNQISPQIIKFINDHQLNDIVHIPNTKISEKIFEITISKSHYIILPTKKNSIYGKYKISGQFGDAIAFNIPLLLSEHYLHNNPLKNFPHNHLITLFNEDNLYEVIVDKLKPNKQSYKLKP